VSHIQVQFDCPVGVIVDTDTGAIVSVHVWDDSIDTTKPRRAYYNEYLSVDHPDFERALALHIEQAEARGIDMSDERGPDGVSRRLGVSMFEELPLDDPRVKRAHEVITDDDPEWPGWEFGP
jgi:hypothetical protein